MKVEQTKYKISRVYTVHRKHCFQSQGEKTCYLTGHQVRPECTVMFYYQGYGNDFKLLSMDIYLNGYNYSKTIIDVDFTNLQISRQCGKFAREVMNTI